MLSDETRAKIREAIHRIPCAKVSCATGLRVSHGPTCPLWHITDFLPVVETLVTEAVAASGNVERCCAPNSEGQIQHNSWCPCKAAVAEAVAAERARSDEFFKDVGARLEKRAEAAEKNFQAILENAERHASEMVTLASRAEAAEAARDAARSDRLAALERAVGAEAEVTRLRVKVEDQQ